MRAKYLSKKVLRIPVLTALTILLTFQSVGVSAAGAVEKEDTSLKYAVVSEAQTLDFLTSTAEIMVSYPNTVNTANIQQLSGASSLYNPNLTQEQRVENMKNELEKLIDKYELLRNTGTGYPYYDENPMLGHILMNENVRNLIRTDIPSFRGLASMTFSDIPEDAWYGEYIALAVYAGVVNGYPDGTFQPEQSITIGEYSVLFLNLHRDQRYKQIEEEIKAYREAGSPGYEYRGLEVNWWAPWFFVQSGLYRPHATFWYPQNRHLSNAYAETKMTRGDLAYAMAKYYFADELSAMILRIGGNDSGQNTGGYMPTGFTDITHINPATTPKNIFDNNTRVRLSYDDGDTSFAWTEFQLLSDCVANPKDGVPVSWLAALTVLREKGIMQGYSGGESGWNDPVTRAQAVYMMANIFDYFMKNR